MSFRNRFIQAFGVLLSLTMLFVVLLLVVEDGWSRDDPVAMEQTREHNRTMYPEVRYITAHQALALFDANRLILIDSDSEGSFAHLAVVGAINIPAYKLKRTRFDFKRNDVTIGVYCH
ncbi:MAG TPA: hypothetical protein VEF34_18540 [Syntrophobacteraceae bacterium]|nr:hypothetical protein [Syntrophobacteraceae bacterium]